MDVQLEPTSRLGSSEEAPWDSDSENSEPSWSQRGVCPDLDQDQDQDRARAQRKLLLAGAVGILFTIAEAVGGYLSQSLAVLSDSAHLLSDVCSVGLSLFSLWISSRSPTDTMTFGWHRAEVLAVLVSLLSLWGVTLVLLWSAGLRLRHDFSLDSRIMLLTSSCAVCVNLLMVCILHQGSAHTHSHGSVWGQRGPHTHGPGPGPSLGPDRSNCSVRAAFVHVLGDLLQSLGVLLAAVVIHVWPQYKVADPLCTFLFSALVLWTTIPVFRDVLRVLMEATPPHIDLTHLRELLLSLHGVTSVHSLRVWSLSPGCPLLSVHITAEGGSDSQLVLRSCTDLLLSEFHFRHITVQVEKNQDQD
uniref:Zinc transporter 2-like n=1 Tax=Knipowitschia caucasica TaxID=637954 RepID=A0AAV2JHU8_KNICA